MIYVISALIINKRILHKSNILLLFVSLYIIVTPIIKVIYKVSLHDNIGIKSNYFFITLLIILYISEKHFDFEDKYKTIAATVLFSLFAFLFRTVDYFQYIRDFDPQLVIITSCEITSLILSYFMFKIILNDKSEICLYTYNVKSKPIYLIVNLFRILIVIISISLLIYPEFTLLSFLIISVSIFIFNVKYIDKIMNQ